MHFTRVLAQLMRIVLNYWDYACIDCMQSFLKCDTSSAMSDFSWCRLFVSKWSPLHLCSRWKNDCLIFMSGYWPILEKLHHPCSNTFQQAFLLVTSNLYGYIIVIIEYLHLVLYVSSCIWMHKLLQSWLCNWWCWLRGEQTAVVQMLEKQMGPEPFRKVSIITQLHQIWTRIYQLFYHQFGIPIYCLLWTYINGFCY